MLFKIKKIVIFIIFNLKTTTIHTGEPYLASHDLDPIAYSNEVCQIPNYPWYTKYEILNEDETVNRTAKPGEYYWRHYGPLMAVCDRRYKLIPFSSKISVCLNGIWTPSLSTCLRACSGLMSTKSTNVVCKYNGSLLKNCNDPVEGTTARITCNPLYSQNSLRKNIIHLCSKGRWNASIPHCSPDCGVRRPLAVPNIVNGEVTLKGEYPWHVGIYSNKNLICGGAIIERNIVLSAAQCFTSPNGTVQPVENYHVGAGKYYNRYNDINDKKAQFSEVLKIHIPERYKALLSNFENDISILILKTPFTLSENVQPVCVEMNQELLNLKSSSENGIVTGWGYTEEGASLSNKLRELEIPYVPYDKCFDEVPRKFKKYITTDKFCGGYLNNSKSVCTGDSGGPLVFYNPTTAQYFLKGIVSVAPSKNRNKCDPDQYSVYTCIKCHMKFVKAIVNTYRLYEVVKFAQDEDDLTEKFQSSYARCLLPNFPLNGKYSVVNQNSIYYKPGEYLPESSILYLTCDSGYKTDSQHLNQYSICLRNGQWTPPLGKCARTCSTLASSSSTSIKCEYKGQPLESCENPVEGTKALLSCNPFYENPILQKNPIFVCTEGKWNSSITQCLPICGTPTKTDKDFHSWHVGIYDLEKKFVCGGSIIINTKIILSAAQCFTDYDNNKQLAENYLVAAGKFYREYDDYRDKDAQYAKIQQIHIPDLYKGRVHYNTYNIAILILHDFLLMSSVVQPACLQLNEKSLSFDISPDSNSIGEVRGWGYVKEIGKLSDVLKDIEILCIPLHTCYAIVPNTFKKYVTFDKICGEYTKKETSLCGGDSGGGLIFYNMDQGRYYIKGVASDSFSTDENQCDLNKYTLYTLLSFHIDYLNEIISNYL